MTAIFLILASVGTARADADVNLAPVATSSSSHVSGDTSLGALNDGHAPESSHVRGRGSYGNWPSRGTQWVQYEWSQPVSTRKIDVYWWDDHRGVRLPKACRLLYHDGRAFVPVGNPSGLGTAANQYNTTTFDEVLAPKLRLEIDGDGDFSTGILEWKVYDTGKSPDFPPTVDAGIDRLVVLGGKTYLSGEVRTFLGKETPMVAAWSKASGPGSVTFADASNPVTTATFSTLGEHVLELTAGKAPLRGASTVTVKVIPPAPPTHLDPVATQRYTLDSPFWNARARSLIVHWIPHCIAKISDPELSNGGINNFVDAANKLAGKPFAKHRGYHFSNAWVHNTVESICVALLVDPRGDREIIDAQRAMRATLEDWIPKILAAQEPDGYLQTAFTLGDIEHWSPRHRGSHEGYVAGYFLEAAVAHHAMTQGTDTRLYDAARRLADCWREHLGPSPKQAWWDGHQAMEIGLVRFGRYVNQVEGSGKGDRYIELARFLLDCRRDGHKYDQSHVPVIQQYEAVGHAVRASYSYAGMADIAMLTGDIDYQSAVMSLWDNLINRKYYVTGGIGSGETSEGFGPDYSLRHNAYCESCSSCGEIFFQHKLNMIHHDARYADLYEETLYNALLGSIDLEGKTFYYTNPLDSRGPRHDWHGCPCCVGNIPRVLLMLPTWTYVKGVDRLHVNLFVGGTVPVGEVAGTDVQMVQKTNYPHDGNVAIIVNPAKQTRFTLAVRLPNRDVSQLYTATPESDGITSITVEGTAISPPVENGYALIDRVWTAGDRIDLVLPMKIQRIKAVDQIVSTRDRVALRRGPLIHAVESIDQPLDQILRADSPLTAQWRPTLLDGVTIIHGSWSDGTELLAIPYHARHNRPGPTQSSVWLKDR